MKKKLKQLLALVLTLALVMGFALPAAAADPGPRVTIEKVSNDAVTAEPEMHTAETKEDTPQYADTDMVRVSITLAGASTIDAGYATRSIANNAAADIYRTGLKVQQQAMAQRISQDVLGGEALDVVWNMTLLTNTISANVPYGKIEAIEALDGVASVTLENRYEPDVVSTGDADPDMATSGAMIGSTAAWADGYTGAGSRIAVIDTGTDTDHISFDGKAFEYSLEQLAADAGKSKDEFVASLDLLDVDEIAAVLPKLNISKLVPDASKLYLTSKLPFAFNYVDEDFDITHDNDKQGEHGSHVAGIATANRYVSDGKGGYEKALDSVFVQGVAPDAQLITMKVFGKGGGAYDSDYMVAIEDAVMLGCDAVNLSLGSGNAGFTTPDAKYQSILDKLAETDTVVSISAGNSSSWPENSVNGTGVLYLDDVNFATGGSPGSYKNSFGVASVDNSGTTGYSFSYGDGAKVFYTDTADSGYTNKAFATLDTSADGSGTEYEYVYFENTGADADGNSLLTDYADVVSGKIAFVFRGTSSFYQKHMAVAAAGAAGAVVCNNQAGVIRMDLSNSTATIPCISILQTEAADIKAASTPVYAENGTTVLYYTGKLTVSGKMSTSTGSSDSYTMSDFSSWGVPSDLSMKPEITAPGGNIYSVNGAVAGGQAYEVMSGTSMAAPQVAGMAALVAQYIRENGLKEKTGVSVRHLAQSLLMSTAEPVYDASTKSWYSILRQGAGLANVSNAIHAESYVLVNGQPDGKVKVELGDDPDRTGVYSADFTLNNLTDEAIEYTLSADVFTQAPVSSEGVLYLLPKTVSMAANVVWTVDGKVLTAPSELTAYDFDKDGDTDADDAQLLLDDVTAGAGKLKADVDGDGDTDAHDVSELLKLISAAKVVLPADGSISVHVTFSLIDEEKEFLDAYYTNGAYVEAFLYANPVSAEDGVERVSHSIPVLGFYGQGTFDNKLYHFTAATFAEPEDLGALDDELSIYMAQSSLAWDAKNQKLVFTLATASNFTGQILNSAIYTIDPTTRESKKLADHSSLSVILGCYVKAGRTDDASHFAPSTEAMAVSLSESTLSLLVNEKATLTAQANPWTLSDRSVTWSSSDDSVVTVKNGVVTGVGEGSAVITAASAVDPEVKAECYVTVTTLHITVEGALQDKDGHAQFYQWNLENKSWTPGKLIKDGEISIESTTLASSDLMYLMDATADSWAMHKINTATGEDLGSANGAGVPLWDMAYSSLFSTEEQDQIVGVYYYYLFSPKDPMNLDAYGFKLQSFLQQVGASYFTAIASAGETSVKLKSGETVPAEMFLALDNKGNMWVLNLYYTEADGYSLSGGCYETTLPELAFGGHEDSMYCSLVMADEGTTDGLTLFLSYFTGDTNELYMLNLMQSSDGLYFDATDVGNVGDSVWPATVNRVYGNASIKGIQTAEAAAEKNDIELTAQTVSAEKIERSTQEASGSLNTVSNAAAPAAQRVAAVKGGSMTANGDVDLTLTADETTTNGLLEITWDPSLMDYVSGVSTAQLSSFQPAEGKLLFGYAAEKEIASDAVLANLKFRPKDDVHCDLEVQVKTLQRNAESGLDLSETIVVKSDGVEHNWGEWIVTKQPTCFAPGEETRVCADCGAEQTREIPASTENCPSKAFSDLDNTQWYHEGVDYVLNNELMLGVGGSLFEPDGTVTRAQLAMVLYRVAGKPDVKNTANPFKDVTEGVWYADAVKWAAEAGVVKGISADEFAPEVPVTRQEIATMLYRFAKAEAVAEDKLAAFPDAASVADWAKDAMNWAVATGLINGVKAADGTVTLDAQSGATRAQIATLLMRFLKG